MTVKELIKELQKHDSDMEVRIEDCDMADKITEVERVEFNYDAGDYFIAENAESGEKRIVVLLRHQ